jgi:hypothetical protein
MKKGNLRGKRTILGKKGYLGANSSYFNNGLKILVLFPQNSCIVIPYATRNYN